MHTVVTDRILVLAGTNGKLIGAVRLFLSLMPNQIIRTMLMRPSRKQNFTNPLRTGNLRNNHIEGARLRIVIGNRQLTLWLSDRNLGGGSADTDQLTVPLYVIQMNVVFTSRTFMIRRIDSQFIGSIGLFCCSIPNNIILTILSRPSWKLNFLNSMWC